jgi:predicted MFS family arabinose efflux permease
VSDHQTASPSASVTAGFGRGLILFLAVTVMMTAGSIHFQTPLLAEFGRVFHADAATVGWVPTLSFAGFLSGTLFLVPLGDRHDKRSIILGKFVGLMLSVLVVASAPNLSVLAAACFAAGVCASVSQDILALVAELVEPKERGRAIGTALSGLFVGILLARVGSGFLASLVGWRWTYVLYSALLAAVLPVLFARLPHAAPRTALAYRALMHSLVGMLRTQADLRRASAIQFLLGICYGGFWATLAQMMESLHGLGPAYAGLIGIPGAAGVLIARSAGRWMDRSGVRPVVSAGAGLVISAFVVFGFAGLTIVAVVAGAALLDCGLRAAMVANQAYIIGLDPTARSRSNTVFAVHIWGGNAVGALLASMAWTHFGWLGVCACGIVAATSALVVQRLGSARAEPAAD